MTNDKRQRIAQRNCILLHRPGCFFIIAALEEDVNGIYNIKAINGVINNQAMSS